MHGRLGCWRWALLFMGCVAQAAVAAEDAPLRFGSLTLGDSHTCGITIDHVAYCWGANDHGQLGIGNTKRQTLPVAVAGGHKFVELVTAGDERWRETGIFTCGRTVAGRVLCWGNNHFGQLGDGSRESRSVPTPVDAPFKFRALHANLFEVCGLSDVNELVCWGLIGQEVAADGPHQLAERPGTLPIPAAELKATRFVPMSRPMGTCVMGAQEQLFCWRLSAGKFRASAVTPKGMGMRAVSLGRGLADPCGIDLRGRLVCWGVFWTELGMMQSVPKEIASPQVFRDLAAQPGALWALGEDGRLYAAPLRDGGFYGSTLDGVLTAVRDEPHFAQLAVSASSTIRCALSVAGEAWCEGSNQEGQTGTGSDAKVVRELTRVAGDQRFKWLGTRYAGACGITTEGRAYCWGRNGSGQVGDDSRKDRRVPTPVAAPEPED